MNYAGVQIYETESAMSKPAGCVHTDDMRAMIDHFDKLGLIRDVPAVFQIGGKIYMHPVKYAEFKRAVRVRTERKVFGYDPYRF
jgi:hypothetical protein